MHLPFVMLSLVFIIVSWTTPGLALRQPQDNGHQDNNNGAAHALLNTQFLTMGQVYISYSTWIVDLVVDMTVYSDQLDLLKTDIINFKKSINTIEVEDFHSATEKSYHTRLGHAFKVTKDVHDRLEILVNQKYNAFNNQFDLLLTRLDRIMTLVTIVPANRKKRSSLFPPVTGEIFSLLFNVASGTKVKQLSESVESLKRSQSDVIHVVNDSLSIMKVTQTHVDINRKAINNLINITDTLESRLSDLYSKIKTLEHEIVYTELVSQVDNLFSILMISIQNMDLYLRNLESQLIQAINGKLSISLISPKVLKSILEKIEDQLPAEVKLPADPKRKLRFYYNNLKITISPDNGYFHIIMPIPLINRDSIFDIVRVINLPVSDLKNDDLPFLSYELETKFMGISLDRDNYMLLSDNDLEICKSNSMVYCPLNCAIYSTTNARSCMSSLFLRDVSAVHELCDIRPSNPSRMPIVKHLSGPYWLISSNFDIDLELTCKIKEDRKIITLRRGVRRIKIPAKCSARSQYFSIPYSINVKSDHELQFDLKLPSNELNYNLTINEFYQSPGKFSKMKNLNLLPDFKPADIDHLQQMFKDDGYLSNKPLRMGFDSGIIILVLTSFGIILFVIIRRKLHRNLYCLTKATQDETVELNAISQEAPVPVSY